MNNLVRTLILLGMLFVVVGGALIIFDRMNVPFGRLPGDFAWRGRGWTFSFPLATCGVVSILLTLLLWVVESWRR